MAFEDTILFKTLYYGWQVVPDDKTCSDILWKWHIPGEGHNQEPIKFSELQFYKADVTKGDKGCRKKAVVSGIRDYFATPMFAFELSGSKIKSFMIIWFYQD